MTLLILITIYYIMIIQSYQFAYYMKQKKVANCLMNMPSNINNVYVFSLFCIRKHVHVHTGRADSICNTGTLS